MTSCGAGGFPSTVARSAIVLFAMVERWSTRSQEKLGGGDIDSDDCLQPRAQLQGSAVIEKNKKHDTRVGISDTTLESDGKWRLVMEESEKRFVRWR